MDLTGKVALVTGATRTNGIGAASCRALAAAGASIAFTSFLPYDVAMYETSQREPEILLTELRGMDVQAELIPCDLSGLDVATELLDEIESRVGPLDILVNNAAHSVNDTWEDLTPEKLDNHYAVNVRAMAMLSTEFARRFKQANTTRGGRIVNFSSGQHLGPMPTELSYATSKGAVIAFSQSFATAVSHLGITVNVVNPGATDTGWMSDAFQATLIAEHPQGRIGQPEDAARLVAWLVSDDARWISGQVINSEGGIR